MKKLFLLKGLPPRTSFDKDMSPGERIAVNLHFGYWRQLADIGITVIFSTVTDISGSWGLAIVEVENEDEANRIRDADPIIQADIGFEISVYPLPFPIMRFESPDRVDHKNPSLKS